MSLVFRPVRLPKRTLTTEQAAKFAALRQEVETELAARCAQRALTAEQARRRTHLPWTRH
ncbi:hypothetical protein Cde04nite_35950 [Cellulomonas denverensis]|nr:hypothetical protein Cde04nite_35950 [Cellulomonas denverensis]